MIGYEFSSDGTKNRQNFHCAVGPGLGLKNSGLKFHATFFWRHNCFFVGVPNICHLSLHSVVVFPTFGPYSYFKILRNSTSSPL